MGAHKVCSRSQQRCAWLKPARLGSWCFTRSGIPDVFNTFHQVTNVVVSNGPSPRCLDMPACTCKLAHRESNDPNLTSAPLHASLLGCSLFLCHSFLHILWRKEVANFFPQGWAWCWCCCWLPCHLSTCPILKCFLWLLPWQLFTPLCLLPFSSSTCPLKFRCCLWLLLWQSSSLWNCLLLAFVWCWLHASSSICGLFRWCLWLLPCQWFWCWLHASTCPLWK